jgi:flagellar basal-body rod protein FlgG
MIQNIIYLAAQNGNQQFQVLERVSRNIANYNTTGYKAERFQQYLDPGGRVVGYVRTDTGVGQAIITRHELDVAIESNGYLPVTQPDGTVAYTRDGSFTLDKDRFLVTQRGDLVGTGIQVPDNYEKLLIYPDGTVQVRKTKSGPKETIGKLTLATFPNPEGLKSVGNNKLVPTAVSGEPLLMAEAKFAQGKLERSNVMVPEQIEQVLRLNASMISNFRVIKFSDDIFRQAVNLRQ